MVARPAHVRGGGEVRIGAGEQERGGDGDAHPSEGPGPLQANGCSSIGGREKFSVATNSWSG